MLSKSRHFSKAKNCPKPGLIHKVPLESSSLQNQIFEPSKGQVLPDLLPKNQINKSASYKIVFVDCNKIIEKFSNKPDKRVFYFPNKNLKYKI